MKKLLLGEYPIRDYGIIGNCETGALVKPDGGIDWLCLPAFDSPSILGVLLDREKGGDFSIRPACSYRVERAYLDDSAILQTRFITDKGTVELTDFFVIARERTARFYDFTSLHPTRKLVRIVKSVGGRPVPLVVAFAGAPDYGRESLLWWKTSADPVEYSCRTTRFFSNFPVEEKDGTLTSVFLAEPNKSYFTVLDYSEDQIRPNLEIIHRWLSITKSYWREWNLFNYYRGPRQSIVRRSAVTLKLLTYAPTGAFVAAPTTSLPERIGGEQNWDYRYVWVRDTSLFINTLFRLGYSGEAKAFINFMLNQCAEEYGNGKRLATNKAKALKVLYPIRSGSPTDESFLTHLAGHRRSKPVRVGNRAAHQFQLDNYGHLLEAFYYFRHTGGKIDANARKLLGDLAEDVILCWQEPDNGIWETPEKKHYSYGKIMACIALERAAALGILPSERLKAVSAKVRQDVLSRSLADADGREFLADAYGSDAVDASGLLAFTNGFLSKPLALSTREEIEKRLVSGAFVYRNREQREEEKEGAFLICSFWWISHLIREGKLGRAEEILSQVLDHASPLGLFAEEIDPKSGEFLGNFPQAFSHLGLIGTILNLEQSKKDPQYHSLADAQKFEKNVGPTIGVKGVLKGFMRVPATFQLLFSRRSKWV